MEFVGPTFQLAAQLLQLAAEFDTQLRVFGLFNAVIDRLADGVKPYAGGLMALLPGVWAAAEGHSLLRMQVLLALQRLVNALGAESPAAYPLVLPVLRICTDPGQPDELNLLEDGLQLWLITLRNAPAPELGLLDFFPNLVAAMAASTEHLATGMAIAASAVMLGGADFLRVHGAGVVQILCGFIGNVKERGMLALMPTMHLVVQVGCWGAGVGPVGWPMLVGSGSGIVEGVSALCCPAAAALCAFDTCDLQFCGGLHDLTALRQLTSASCACQPSPCRPSPAKGRICWAPPCSTCWLTSSWGRSQGWLWQPPLVSLHGCCSKTAPPSCSSFKQPPRMCSCQRVWPAPAPQWQQLTLRSGCC